MSTMTYADALEEHAAALEKNALDCTRWQIEMQAVLLAAAPPELTQAHKDNVAKMLAYTPGRKSK